MLASSVKTDTSPVPAYGTTRYSGAIDFKNSVNDYFFTSPRSAYFGSRLLCSSADLRSKDTSIRRTITKRNRALRGSEESSTVSFCMNVNEPEEEGHCTCGDIEPDENLCTCFENKRTDSESTCELSTTNWKELHKLTDTSETKLENSVDDIFNCMNNGDTYTFLDMFEPHPRREPGKMKGKDLPPSGYNLTLVLPQCVCLKNYQEFKKNSESKSDDTLSDEKSATVSELICVPSIAELSWDILQSGAFERIPEKYTTNIFDTRKDEPADDEYFKEGDICQETNSHVSHCLHKEFLEKLDKSNIFM